MTHIIRYNDSHCSGKGYIYNHRFIIIKDTDEQPDEEITKAANSVAGEGQAWKFPSRSILSPVRKPPASSALVLSRVATQADLIKSGATPWNSSPALPGEGAGEKIPPL